MPCAVCWGGICLGTFSPLVTVLWDPWAEALLVTRARWWRAISWQQPLLYCFLLLCLMWGVIYMLGICCFLSSFLVNHAFQGTATFQISSQIDGYRVCCDSPFPFNLCWYCCHIPIFISIFEISVFIFIVLQPLYTFQSKKVFSWSVWLWVYPFYSPFPR